MIRLSYEYMIDSIRSRIAFAVLVVAIAGVIVAVAVLYAGGGSLKTGFNNNHEVDYKRIITYTPIYGTGSNITYSLNFARITEMPTNSAIRFLNPYGKTMSSLSQDSMSGDPISLMTDAQKLALLKDADAFEQYILIRLPPELGGNLQNVSAFRAYSSLDPESKCLLGYRGDFEIGPILQDPCHSDIFRVSDGYSCFGRIVGTNPVLASYNAIPRLRLSVDGQGYVFAARPDGQPSGDGTVGEGRIMPIEEIRAGESDRSCNFNK